MAQVKPEVLHLQRLLGLIESNGRMTADKIFICIDCEAYERNQDLITEIGVTVLDPKALKNIDSGLDGSARFSAMKSVHLRPSEYKHLVNKAFVKGCPDKFDFGKTQFIKLADAGKILHRIFDHPDRIHEACDLDIDLGPSARANVVLVGHALSGDTKYLRRVGFSPSNVVARMDTQKLAAASKKNAPGLKRLLAALKIPCANLHNGGNDSAYTMQALVSLAVWEHHEVGSVAAALAKEREEAIAAKKPKRKRKTE